MQTLSVFELNPHKSCQHLFHAIPLLCLHSVKLIHMTHFHTHRVPPKHQWQSPSSSQQPPRRGGHQEDSRYKPTVRMSGQGFGWGRGGRGRGWALAGCWGFDVPMRRKGQRSLAECQWKTQTFFSSSVLSRALSSVPRGHHRPKRTHARSVALLGKQSLWFIKIAPGRRKWREDYHWGAPTVCWAPWQTLGRVRNLEIPMRVSQAT